MRLDEQDKQWMSEQLQQQLALSEGRMKEHMERIETSLLTAFHSWASPRDARQRADSARNTALELEYQDLEDRLKKLEGQQ